MALSKNLDNLLRGDDEITYIGAEYIIETTEKKDQRFLCMLCSKHADFTNMKCHLNSHRHRENFLARRFPTILNTIRQIKKYEDDPDFKTKTLNKISRFIEEKYGKTQIIHDGTHNYKDVQTKYYINDKTESFYDDMTLEKLGNIDWLIDEIENGIFLEVDKERKVEKSTRINHTKHARNDLKQAKSLSLKIVDIMQQKTHLKTNEQLVSGKSLKETCQLLTPFTNNFLVQYRIKIYNLLEKSEEIHLEYNDENYKLLKKIKATLKTSPDLYEASNVIPARPTVREKAIESIRVLQKQARLTAKRIKGIEESNTSESDEELNNSKPDIRQVIKDPKNHTKFSEKDLVKAYNTADAVYMYDKHNFKNLPEFNTFSVRKGEFSPWIVDRKIDNEHKGINFDDLIIIELHNCISYKSKNMVCKSKQSEFIQVCMEELSDKTKEIFCDASHNSNHTTCASIYPFNGVKETYILKNYCSVALAEMHAIHKSLELASKLGIKNAIIYTDSELCCNILRRESKNDKIGGIISDILDLIVQTEAEIIWIPSHYMIKGNEDADSFAKKAKRNGIWIDNKIFPIDEASYYKSYEEAETMFDPTECNVIIYKIPQRYQDASTHEDLLNKFSRVLGTKFTSEDVRISVENPEYNRYHYFKTFNFTFRHKFMRQSFYNATKNHVGPISWNNIFEYRDSKNFLAFKF